MTLLQDAHREENLEQVMCRTLISVDWQGYVYDCDFNQMLGLPLRASTASAATRLADLVGRDLAGRPIVVARPLLRLHRRAGLELRRGARLAP